MMIKKLPFHFLCALSLLSIPFFAQNKKTLTFDEMTSWESIKARQISNNATYVVYETSPLRGDYKTFVYNTGTQTTDTLLYLRSAKISGKEDFLVARLSHPYDSIRQMKIDKVSKDKMPKDSVLICSLPQSEILFTFPKVKNYKVSTFEGNYAAILLEKGALKKASAGQDSSMIETVDSIKTEIKAEKDTIKTDKAKDPKKLGDILITYNGTRKDTTVYESVTEYTLAKKGTTLAFIQAYEDSLKRSEVFMVNTKDDEAVSIFKTDGEIKKLTLSEDGEQLAFMFSNDTTEIKQYALAYALKTAPAHVLIDSTIAGMPEDWNVSVDGHLWFNKEGSRLFMGTSKMQRPEPEDSVPADEIPGVDVWSWTDLRLQPQQLLEAKKDKKKSYQAVYDFKTETFSQLANEEYDHTSLDREAKGNYVLMTNGKPYLRASNWTGRWSKDIAIKEIESGETKVIAKDMLSPRFSYAGNYACWFNDKDTSIYCYSIANETITKLNKDIPYPIYDELNDRPMIPEPYGLMGWAKDDKYLYIYDRYDIWQVDPEGKKASVCITNEFGRKNKIKLRYARLDKELSYVPQDIYLYGENVENNNSYYYSATLKKAATPKELLGGAFALNSILKAKNTDELIWSKMTVNEYPDIRFSGSDFNDVKVVSAMNPQQKKYNWATVDTLSWTSFNGDKLKGLIYKPEDFDPAKKYPVMCYFYERNFDTQHHYFTPSPSRSIINRTFYASNGYIVFVPDITYTNGYPGQSAYNAIVSGAQALIERYSWVDAQHLALSGQSWGGYQTAYLITQTDLFAAAMGGAVVSNMTSAYGGIRWGSGLNRQFQYEKTQSRIGGTLWEKPMQYIENSPLFYAPKVNTPLLLMHNDKDTAVPWYQGIEYFTALRRLDKPVWMLNYNNEPHNLKAESIANRLDLSKRMKQFFDHYLKDAPAPKWMTNGIPAVEKGKNLGY